MYKAVRVQLKMWWPTQVLTYDGQEAPCRCKVYEWFLRTKITPQKKLTCGLDTDMDIDTIDINCSNDFNFQIK